MKIAVLLAVIVVGGSMIAGSYLNAYTYIQDSASNSVPASELLSITTVGTSYPLTQQTLTESALEKDQSITLESGSNEEDINPILAGMLTIMGAILENQSKLMSGSPNTVMVDGEELVTKELLFKQADRTSKSGTDSIRRLSEDFSTEILTVTGNTNLDQLDVSGNTDLSGDLFLSGNLSMNGITSQTEIANLDMNSGGFSLDVAGSYAYISNYSDNTMYVIDVSDKQNPVIVGSTTDSVATAMINADTIEVVGKYLYLVSRGEGLQIIDISNPTNPLPIASTTLSGASGLYVSGSYAYTASANRFEVVDISDPTNPTKIAELLDDATTELTDGRAVTVRNGYAYVVSRFSPGGLQIIDISDPTNPIHVAKLSDGIDGPKLEGANDIYVDGKYAYIAVANDGAFVVADISDSQNPSVVATVDTVNGEPMEAAHSISVVGKYAYIGVWGVADSPNILVFDISNPANPTLVDTVIPGGSVASVAIEGNYVFTISWDYDFRIMALGGLDTPTGQIGALQTNMVTVSQNLKVLQDAYVGSGLQVGDNGIVTTGSINAAGEESSFFNGRVGIGTTSPADLLTVNGAVYLADTVPTDTTSRLYSNSGDLYWNGSIITSSTTGNWTSGGGNVYRLSGNVGIGSTSPSSRLTVEGGNTALATTTINGALTVGRNIISLGKIGIGSTTPSSKLSISSEAGQNPFSIASSSGAMLLRFTDEGYLGLGTNSPSRQFEITGSMNLPATASSTNGMSGVIYSGGEAFIHNYYDPSSQGGNTFVGIRSGNFTLGPESGDPTWAGSLNTALGFESLRSNTSGVANTAIGFESLESATRGGNNTALGFGALHTVAEGNGNTALGSAAFYGLISGEDNIAIGVNAGRYLVDNSNHTSSSRSIFIGRRTSPLADSETNSVVIGFEAEGLGSNTVVLGNDSVVTTALKGKVGIGTTTPSAQLTVDGTVQLSVITGGTLETDALGNVTVSSDERLKSIIGAYVSGLDKILGLEPISYTWNEESGYDMNTVYAGFSAQNVEDFIPEAVGENSQGYKTLSTRPILAAVVNAIQELWSRVEELFDWKGDVDVELKNLRAENEWLKDRLETIEEEFDIEPPQPPALASTTDSGESDNDENENYSAIDEDTSTSAASSSEDVIEQNDEEDTASTTPASVEEAEIDTGTTTKPTTEDTSATTTEESTDTPESLREASEELVVEDEAELGTEGVKSEEPETELEEEDQIEAEEPETEEETETIEE